jgi:hypothetical protein
MASSLSKKLSINIDILRKRYICRKIANSTCSTRGATCRTIFFEGLDSPIGEVGKYVAQVAVALLDQLAGDPF